MSVKMDYPFMVMRGWPQDGALDSNEIVSSGSTVAAGDVVELQADGTVDAVGAASANTINVGFVVRGNGDSDSVAAAGDKAVIVWSGFMARTQKCDTTGLSVGDPVQAANGILEAVTTGAAVAYVKEVHAAANGDPASLTVIVR